MSALVPVSRAVPAVQRLDSASPVNRRRRLLDRVRRDDRGLATAEYAVATVAACGFGGVLAALLRSDVVRELILQLIQRALSWVF